MTLNVREFVTRAAQAVMAADGESEEQLPVHYVADLIQAEMTPVFEQIAKLQAELKLAQADVRALTGGLSSMQDRIEALQKERSIYQKALLTALRENLHEWP